jgi:hypothetical protein
MAGVFRSESEINEKPLPAPARLAPVRQRYFLDLSVWPSPVPGMTAAPGRHPRRRLPVLPAGGRRCWNSWSLMPVVRDVRRTR